MEAENVIRGLLLQLEVMVAGSPEPTIPQAPLQPLPRPSAEELLRLPEFGELIAVA